MLLLRGEGRRPGRQGISRSVFGRQAEAVVANEADVVVENVVVERLADGRTGGRTGSTTDKGANESASERTDDHAGRAAQHPDGAPQGGTGHGAGITSGRAGNTADDTASFATNVLGGSAVGTAGRAGEMH